MDKSNFVYVSLTVTIMGNIILWPLALTFADLSTINPESLLLFVFAGVLAPGIGRLFYFRGMETVGISANASIFAIYPLYTSIMAVLFLGEGLTVENWTGLACIITGVIFIGRNMNSDETTLKGKTKRFLVFPILGSLAIAFSDIVRKEALNIYNQPLLGVAVGYTATLIVYLLVMAFSKDVRTSRFSRKDLEMFWKPGVGIAAAWLLRFIALSQEMVSIVVPILQTQLIFILFFTYIFLRKLEKISFKLIIGTLLIIGGIILISIN